MDAIVRHRAAIVMSVVVVVVILAVLLGRHAKNGGGQSIAGVPRIAFGARVPKPGASRNLSYTNGWTATAGRDMIGVYAGRQSSDSRNGLLVILRRTGGHEKLTRVTVHASGTLTLLRPPPEASEQGAFNETLRFITANGASGTLSLSGDSVKLSG